MDLQVLKTMKSVSGPSCHVRPLAPVVINEAFHIPYAIANTHPASHHISDRPGGGGCEDARHRTPSHLSATAQVTRHEMKSHLAPKPYIRRPDQQSALASNPELQSYLALLGA